MSGTNTDPQQDQLMTIGHDQRLALGRVAVNDAPFIDDKLTQFAPKAAQNIRPYLLDHADVLPAGANSAQVAFNSQVTFKFGNEGRPNLYAAVLHITLPKVSGDGTYHPTHASSTAAQPGGAAGSATFLDWVPYVAEKFVGGSAGDENLRIKYGTDTLRAHNSTAINVKRALNMDSEATTKRAAYNNSVGAIPDSTAYSRRFRLPLWLPQSTDDVNFHQMLPVQAFGQEFQLTFKIPPMLELLRGDCASAPIAAVTSTEYTPTVPSCFLRLHYHVPEKAERGHYANQLLKPMGLSFQTMHVAKETQTTGITYTAQTVKISIRNSTNPCVYLVGCVRMADDLKAVGAASIGADTNVPARSISSIVVCPDWERYQLWDTVAVYDGGSRITAKRGYDDWQNNPVDGISAYFPCDITSSLIVVPFSAFPRIENSGMGHLSLSSMNSPALWIDLPAIGAGTSTPQEATTQTRTIDIFYFERNMVHMKNGNIIRVWNVQE